MIGFFPKRYPDELLYSQICRYHVRSGNGCYRSTADEIYAHGGTVRPDPEFLNRFTGDALQWITRGSSIEKVIQEHTMFPAYGRFLPKERRHKAFDALCRQTGNFSNLLAVDITGARCLQYCPDCANNDREKYGETYWHRVHQIRNIGACPVHSCLLMKTEIPISNRLSPAFYDAESYVPKDMPPMAADCKTQISLAQYMADVMQEPVDLETEYPIGRFLHDRLNHAYVSSSGLVRNMEKLSHDIQSFYPGIVAIDIPQMQKVFNGYRFNNALVCAMALFEGISAYDLTHLPEEYTPHGVEALYQDLAKQYSLDVGTVKTIGSAVLSFVRKGNSTKKSGPRLTEWQLLDDKLFPSVKRVVDGICHADGKPQRVSVAAVTKELHLPQKQLFSLPKCKAYIESHEESTPEYWARKISWAVKEMQNGGISITESRILKMTNIRKHDLISCIPYIKNAKCKNIVQNMIDKLDATT